jgi:hypothetical protein
MYEDANGSSELESSYGTHINDLSGYKSGIIGNLLLPNLLNSLNHDSSSFPTMTRRAEKLRPRAEYEFSLG